MVSGTRLGLAAFFIPSDVAIPPVRRMIFLKRLSVAQLSNLRSPECAFVTRAGQTYDILHVQFVSHVHLKMSHLMVWSSYQVNIEASPYFVSSDESNR